MVRTGSANGADRWEVNFDDLPDLEAVVSRNSVLDMITDGLFCFAPHSDKKGEEVEMELKTEKERDSKTTAEESRLVEL